MNFTEKTCCDGNRIVSGRGECCGRSDTVYNPDTHVCIGDTAYRMPPDGDPWSFYGVCNGNLYDTEKEICCEEVIFAMSYFHSFAWNILRKTKLLLC